MFDELIWHRHKVRLYFDGENRCAEGRIVRYDERRGFLQLDGYAIVFAILSITKIEIVSETPETSETLEASEKSEAPEATNGRQFPLTGA